MASKAGARRKGLEEGFLTRLVDAAFGLVPAFPAARAGIFAGRNLVRARLAANRREAARDQWMTRQVVFFEIGSDILRAPVNQRIDLETALRIAGVDFKARQVCASCRLERLAPGEAGIEPRKRFFKRADLADFAAPIRIIRPSQAGFILCRKITFIRREDLEVLVQFPRYRPERLTLIMQWD